MVKQLFTNKFIIISLVIMLIAGMANGTMDTLQFHYSGSTFENFDNDQFWNPKISDRNKYATDDFNRMIPAPDHWYYKLADLRHQEKFPLSATALVSLTDGWHLAKLIYNWSLMIIITLLALSPIVVFSDTTWFTKLKIGVLLFIVLNTIEAVGFHFIYSFLN